MPKDNFFYSMLLVSFITIAVSTTCSAEALIQGNTLQPSTSKQLNTCIQTCKSQCLGVLKRNIPLKPSSGSTQGKQKEESSCPRWCTCKSPGPRYGSPSFNELQLSRFGQKKPSIWVASSYPVPPVFQSSWDINNAQVTGGRLALKIEKRGDDLFGAELRTDKSWYGYGCVSACMKPIPVSGVITALFTYTGPYDGPKGAVPRHNEIDIEFQGRDTTKVVFNYFTNDGKIDKQNNAKEYKLPFDASSGFHVFGFRWTPDAIEWEVDGKSVYKAGQTAEIPPPIASALTVQKIMASAWVVADKESKYFGGYFNKAAFKSAQAEYKWIRYVKLDSNGCCQMPSKC